MANGKTDQLPAGSVGAKGLMGAGFGVPITKLSQNAQWWLKGYLQNKTPKKEDVMIYQVLERTVVMLTDGSERNEDWWMMFLWRVATVYHEVPAATLINRLWGKIDTPPYVKILEGFGPWKDWEYKMAVHALSIGMDEAEITAVISASVLEAACLELNMRPAWLVKPDDPVIIPTQMTALSLDDRRAILRADLEVRLLTWQPELINWLVEILIQLRVGGMPKQREEDLLKLLGKADKDYLDYAIIMLLERPAMQQCLLGTEKAHAQETILQLAADLMYAKDEKSLKPEDLERFIGFGLPTWDEFVDVLGRGLTRWHARIMDCIQNGTITDIARQASSAAKAVHQREFLKELCEVLEFHWQNSKTLIAHTRDANNERKVLVLNFAEARKI